MRISHWFGLLVALLLSTGAMAQTRTGLPFDLDFFMSRQQVLSHLKALDMYRVESGRAGIIAYVVPAPDTDTTNGLFLEFVDDSLIEIASTKTDMNKALFEKYMADLLLISENWKASGVETILEDKTHSLDLLRKLSIVLRAGH